MKQLMTALLQEMALGDGNAPPTDFQIFKAGANATKKGTFVFDEEAAKSVTAAAADWGNDFHIDYEHAILSGAPNPAAGWFTPAVRDGALWATNVRWTDKARTYLAQKEYRFISPLFRHSKEGRVLELMNVALTNLPATKRQQPLIAASLIADGDHHMNAFLTALGLAGDASEAEGLAALTKMRELPQKLAALTGKTDQSEILGTISGWKATTEQVAALSTELASLKASEAKREVDALIAQGLAEGKIVPATEEAMRSAGMKDQAWLKAFLTAAPVTQVAGKPAKESAAPASADKLTEIEKLVALSLGLKPEDVQATKLKMVGTN